VASSTNNRLGLPDSQDQQRRHSRTDLDFEEALASPDTILLREGIDLFSPEHEASVSLTPPPCRPSLHGYLSSASGKYEGSSPNPKGRNTATPLKQPGTPNVIPATPTPPRNDTLYPLTTSSSNSTPFHTPLASPEPSCDGEDSPSPVGSQPSPKPPNSSHPEGIRLPLYDAEDREHQVRRRSMYRSPGSASSPDLVTLLKKTKQRNGLANANSNGTGNRDTLRVDTQEAGSGGGRLRTTSATPSSASSNSIPHQGQRPRAGRTTTNGSSSSYRRGGDSSGLLGARSQDWVLPSPSPSPTPSPSTLKARFPLRFAKSTTLRLTLT